MSSVGRLCFLRSGRSEADLKEWGKIPSESARLMMLVIGSRRESRQDLSRKVGMISKAQDEFEDLRIAVLTSSMLAGFAIACSSTQIVQLSARNVQLLEVICAVVKCAI